MVKITENWLTEKKVHVLEARCMPYKNGRDGWWLQIVADDGAKYSASKGAERILDKFKKHDADWWTLKCFRSNDRGGNENWIVSDAEPARQDLGMPTVLVNLANSPERQNLSDQQIQEIAVDCIETTKAQGRERWIDALENYGPTEADVFDHGVFRLKACGDWLWELDEKDKILNGFDYYGLPAPFSRYEVLAGADSFSEMQTLCEKFGLNYEYARRRWKWQWIRYNQKKIKPSKKKMSREQYELYRELKLKKLRVDKEQLISELPDCRRREEEAI